MRQQIVYVSKTRIGAVGFFTNGMLVIQLNATPTDREEAQTLAERYGFVLDENWNRL